MRGPAVGRAAGRRRRTCPGRTSTSGWQRCGRARWSGTPPVLRVDGDLLYLDRYWLEEQQVCDDVLAMIATTAATTALAPDLDRLFPARIRGAACGRGSCAVAGDDGADRRPGNGQDDHGGAAAGVAGRAGELAGRPLRIALAAPTGKAAARLQEAVQLRGGQARRGGPASALAGLQATTLHRLLGSRPDTSARFRHNRGNRLPARRDRGRRDVDGVADDDGAAAGGGAPG